MTIAVDMGRKATKKKKKKKNILDEMLCTPFQSSLSEKGVWQAFKLISVYSAHKQKKIYIFQRSDQLG